MLDKQYSRIIRWTNRARTMSEKGNFSDAIMDVECARAELDDARQELLLCHKNGKKRKNLFFPVMVSVTAFASVFYFCTPTRHDTAERGFVPYQTEIVATAPVPSPEKQQQPPEQAASEPSVHGSAEIEPPANATVVAKENTSISAEQMYRLMEVGRRALQKNPGTVVLEFN